MSQSVFRKFRKRRVQDSQHEEASKKSLTWPASGILVAPVDLVSETKLLKVTTESGNRLDRYGSEAGCGRAQRRHEVINRLSLN